MSCPDMLAVDTSELSSRLSVNIYTFLVCLLLQLSCPCRQVQQCNPILSYGGGNMCLSKAKSLSSGCQTLLNILVNMEHYMLEQLSRPSSRSMAATPYSHFLS
eukprot:1145172-Pelagomonas_calceolata.AAC.1